MLKRLCILPIVAVGLLGTATAQPASEAGSDWPSKTVKIIAPETAGGGLDRGARILADLLSKEFGQAFVVENMPGAANTVGTSAVARAEPDGYTILHTSQSSIAIVPLVMKSINYKTDDLVPVGQTMQTSNTFVINPDKIPSRTLPEFIELLKQNPDKYTYGSSGVGGWSHLIHELFMLKTGIKIKHVPYGGATAVRQAILGGHIDMGIVNTSAVLGDIQAGTLIAIAVPTPTRLEQLPDVPTINEAVPDFGGLRTWNGFFVPAGTPQAIIDKLSAFTAKAVHEPGVVEAFKGMGADPVGSSPSDFSAFIQREVDVWRGVVEANEIVVE